MNLFDLEAEFYENFGAWKNDILCIEQAGTNAIRVIMKDGREYKYGHAVNGELFLVTLKERSQ